MVANAAIGWSVIFDAQPVIRVAVQSSTIENLTIPVVVGRHYYAHKNAGDHSLLAAMKTGFDTHTSGAVFTVSASIISGRPKVTIAADTPHQIKWANAATTFDAGIVGNHVSDDAVYASSRDSDLNNIGTIWEPRRPVSFDSRDRDALVRGISRSLSGQTRISSFGEAKSLRRITFEKFAEKYALEESLDSDEPRNYFEKAWKDSMSLGNPFEVIEDVSDLQTATEYRAASVADPLSRDSQYPILWGVELEMSRT